MSAGPVPFGEYCTDPSDCGSGTCLNTGLSSNYFGVCSQPCSQNGDCPDGTDCMLGVGTMPMCVDRDWMIGTIYHTGVAFSPRCTHACSAEEICTERGCQTGFQPPVLRPAHPDFPHTCLTNHDCALPGECLETPSGERQCVISCSRNEDCPWAADCMSGICRVASDFFPYQPNPFPCAGGTGCDPSEMCLVSHFPLSDPFERFFCVDEDPCFDDAECPQGFQCEGVCTRSCSPDDPGITPDVCLPGQQCVLAHGDGWTPYKCLPPVCDCAETGGAIPYCRLSDQRCSYPRSCTRHACDGTFGPPNPDPANDETCCAPGNPCGLSPEESCACPPSCSFWSASHCCSGDNCPTAGTPTACQAPYVCAQGTGQLFGWACVQP